MAVLAQAGTWSINRESTALVVACLEMKKNAALPLTLLVSPSGDKQED